MRPRINTSRWLSFARRSFIGLCVAAHLAITIGFPLPRAGENVAHSEPFPCQHHQCGCRSAEQCWRSCCCLSTQEKLAWATQHGVTPPDYVLAAAEMATRAHQSRACCEHSHERQTACNASSCIDTDPHCRTTNTAVGTSPERGSPVADGGHSRKNPVADWVLGIHAYKCQGLATLWVVSGALALPPPLLQAPADSAPPIWRSDLMVCRWRAISKQPDVPPPRDA